MSRLTRIAYLALALGVLAAASAANTASAATAIEYGLIADDSLVGVFDDSGS